MRNWCSRIMARSPYLAILLLVLVSSISVNGASLEEAERSLTNQVIAVEQTWHQQPNQARLQLQTLLASAKSQGNIEAIHLSELFLGRLDVRQGNWTLAQERLLKASNYFAQSSVAEFRHLALISKIEYYIARGSINRARNSLESLKTDADFQPDSKVGLRHQQLFGQTLVYEGAYAQAVEVFSQVLAHYDQNGDQLGEGAVNMMIAETYYKAKNYGLAKLRCKTALSLFESQQDAFEQARARLLMGKCERELQQFDIAEIHIESAFRIAQKLGSTSLLLKSSEARTALYKARGEYEQALAALEDYQAMKDSLLNEQTLSAIEEIEARFELRRQEQQQAQLETQLNRKSQQTLWLTWVLVIGTVLGCLTIFAYRAKRRFATQLAKEKAKVDKQQKNILESINYAKNIQKSIVTPISEIKASSLQDYVLFLEPRDKVSGDIYWFHDFGGHVVMAAIDCTGHGIPGAFMALIGHTLLNDIVIQRGQSSPAEILRLLNLEVIHTLQQVKSDLHAQDGMDMTICTIDITTRTVTYAGARNHLFVVQDQNLEVKRATMMSIGGKPLRKEKSIERIYKEETFTLTGKDAWIYMCTDGFMDQYGGKDRKKYNSRNFKGLLTRCSHNDGETQTQRFKATFQGWMGEEEQIDDVLIFGAKV